MTIYKIIKEKQGEIGEIEAENDIDARRKVRILYGSKQKIKAVRLRNDEPTNLPSFMRY